MTRDDVRTLQGLGADIFTVALDAATPEIFDRTRGKGVQSPHNWAKYWEDSRGRARYLWPQKFGAHIIVGMGETEHDVLSLVQRLVDMGGHSHMFCFFPEQGSLMDHLPATPRDQWRRVQLARYLIDYRAVRVEHMRFDEPGRVSDFGLPAAELEEIINQGWHSAPRAAPAKFREDLSACDRPYGDRPPSTYASYPFQPDESRPPKNSQAARDIPVVEGEERGGAMAEHSSESSTPESATAACKIAFDAGTDRAAPVRRSRQTPSVSCAFRRPHWSGATRP